ncbi:hypothetical protein EXIGLDRAFT_768996 [Exidia glandulosa HHB12029]|uniref:Uncharacterized protein n=1 Tax=Exidia glandulosa HHB12029 TaxID=1314781 RepID=A0A165HTQ5_EXIGL|nr:hypothetical protein EXIGLDRAFT_768996 [Exidia glandulosa HHB12029]
MDMLSLGLVGDLALKLSLAGTRILARLSDTDSRHIRETLNNTLNFESSHGPHWTPLGFTTVPFTITTSLAKRLVRMSLPLLAAPFVQYTTLYLPSLVELNIEVTTEDVDLRRFAFPAAPLQVPALRKLSLRAGTSVSVAVTTTAAEEFVLEGLTGFVVPMHLSVRGVVLVGEWRNPCPVTVYDEYGQNQAQ